MKRNQVTRKVGSLILLRESTETPGDAEWQETLDLLRKHRDELEQIKVLVVSDGGGPSPAHRKKLEEVIEGKRVRVAVVSESVKVRFIVSSVALFTAKISSFRMHEMFDAYAWLELTARERQLASENIAEMSEELKRP